MSTTEHLISFDRLRERLLQGGVARRHVHRTLAELRDHYDDALTDEHGQGRDGDAAAQAAWARLGSEDEIARSIFARPELRSLADRFPRTVFGAGPLLLWCALTFVSVAGVIAFLKGLQALDVLPPRGTPEALWVQSPVNAVVFFYIRILPIIIGAAIAVTAARHSLARSWTMIGTLAISLLSAFATLSVKFPTVPGMPGQLNIGFGVSAEELPSTLSLAALNAGLILLAYGLALRYHRQTGTRAG